MNTAKIIRGTVNSRGFTITSAITQWDYGWQFIPEIDDLPPTYRLDFSNEEKHGTALPVYCSTEGAEVPAELIDTGKDVWVWFVRIGDGFGITEYKWRIPNKCKPKTEQDEPTPTQQSSIDQLIVRSNEAVESAAQSASAASQSARESAESARASGESALSASNSALSSGEYASNALGYAESASASATASAQSASQSAQIKTDVEDMVDDAQASASASAQSATASANSASQASGYAQSASASAQSASGYASSAQTSAQTASSKATEASQSASQASGYAQTAETAKTDAQTAKTQAETARDEAVTAKTAAETAQGKAEDAQAAAESVAESIPSDYSQLSEDVSDLKEELSSIENEVMPVTTVTAYELMAWLQKNLKPNDGTTSTSAVRICTQGYIPNDVSKLTVADSDFKLLVYGYTTSGTYVGMWDGTSISEYSSSKQYMYDEFDMEDAGEYKIKIVLRRADGGNITPSDASKVNCSTIESIADTVDALSADMTTLADAVYKDVLASDVPPTWKQGAFNASTGATTAGTTSIITDGYLSEYVKDISINDNGYLFSVFAYNDDGSYVGLYDEASDTYKTTGWTKYWITAFDVLKQNPNGYKLRLRVKNSEQTTITADKADKLTYKVIRAEYMGSSNPCEYDWKYEACVFDKMLCIGDSLIAGGGNYPDITPDDANATRTITAGMYSNPACLSKYFGIKTTNWGISGATSRSWYNSKSSENWGGYDSALIYIGSNDYNYVTTDGMTIEEGANLSETMLRNIIAKLKADNAGIRIFLCTLLPTTTTGSYAQYRIPLMAKIRTIASDTSGVFLIDLNAYSSFKSNSPYSNGHPTAIGYQWMAREIGAYMCWWISHYPNEFKWIRWIGTRYAVTGTAPDSGDDDGGYGGDVQ